MIRYIIKNKNTGKFLRRTRGYSIRTSWVDSADDATLITTGSAASQIASTLCGIDEYGQPIRYRQRRARYTNYPVEVIKVHCLLIPADTQPFIDGVSNGHIS